MINPSGHAQAMERQRRHREAERLVGEFHRYAKQPLAITRAVDRCAYCGRKPTPGHDTCQGCGARP